MEFIIHRQERNKNSRLVLHLPALSLSIHPAIRPSTYSLFYPSTSIIASTKTFFDIPFAPTYLHLLTPLFLLFFLPFYPPYHNHNRNHLHLTLQTPYQDTSLSLSHFISAIPSILSTYPLVHIHLHSPLPYPSITSLHSIPQIHILSLNHVQLSHSHALTLTHSISPSAFLLLLQRSLYPLFFLI